MSPDSPSNGLPTRRAVLHYAAGLAGAAVAGSQVEARTMTPVSPRLAYVGCRTSRERNAKGDGIAVYRIDAAGAWSRIQLINLVNPSYLAFDRTGRLLCTVHGDGTEASAFRVDPASGELHFLNRVTTGGCNPVHIMPDPTNRFMIVANHVVRGDVKSGIACLPFGETGFAPPSDVVPFDGKIGPHRVEQPFPKPHQVEFDRSGRYIAVPDKGCDRTVVYSLDAQGKLHPVAAAPARASSGPRHIAFHPGNRLAYVINELDSTIQACRFDPANGALTPFQLVSALPDSFTGNSTGAEIAVSDDGRHLYASNRGHDSIGIFAIDTASGRLAPVDWVPSGGKTPRFFALTPDGSMLFISNEEGHNIVRYTVDRRSGRLSATKVVAKTGSPTCILFA